MKFIRKLIKDENGSSVTIELAVFLPILIMMFYAFSLFVHALSVNLNLKTAAREGAREYSVTNSATRGISIATSELSYSGISGANVSSFIDGKGRGIKVRYKYPINIPFVGDYSPTMEATGIFVLEPDASPRK